MKYILYIAQYCWGKTRFSKYIGMQQRFQDIPEPFSSQTHSELVFWYNDDLEVLRRVRQLQSVYGDDNMNLNAGQRDSYFEERWLWVSSSEVDKGARFKFIRDRGNWVFFKMEVTREQYMSALILATHYQGNPYAWTKIIFTQVLKTLWFSNMRSHFCSELVTILLQVSCGMYAGVNSIQENPGKLGWHTDKYHRDKGEWIKHFQKNIF